MNIINKWIMNKFGLINFWYYDEQEFEFLNGHMLLRGSNGSGKSVTMQSVIPLLLDGNMRPERLDPFGSKDRKMITYLLEEDDERTERTGYLYLELKREKSDEYITIGMGVRARKSKQLESWYFIITDGRRIGKDLYLYKSGKEKFTLSKKELENRIGEGGLLIINQKDYISNVNKYIFGFEKTEEYKELIDLLIQIRTPKLSKGLKPTLLNEILSKSLQPLTDDDLRPMAESVENMDKLQTDLEEYNKSLVAANKINNIYKKYNEMILCEKTNNYYNSYREYNNILEELEINEKKYSDLESEIKKLENESILLDSEKKNLEEEKISLESDDIFNLKNKEVEVNDSLKQIKNKIDEKRKNLINKEKREEKYKNDIKKYQDLTYNSEKEIKTSIDDMDSIFNVVTFDEHDFFKDDFINNIDEEFNFNLTINQSRKFKDEINNTLENITKLDEKKINIDRLQKDLDDLEKELKNLEINLIENERQFDEEKIHTKDLIYRWEKSNKELIINDDFHKIVDLIIKDYNEKTNYNHIREIVYNSYEECNKKIVEEILVNENELKILEEELKIQKKYKKEIEDKKEANPFRSDETIESRKILDSKNIPYIEFYKLIEFKDNITEKTKNFVEEALYNMGILDALVIDDSYKEKIIKSELGLVDKYIFTSKENVKNSIDSILTLSDNVNDIILTNKILSVLGSINYNSDDIYSINDEGYYNEGVLTGVISKKYISSYIGIESRKKKREEEIKKLEKVISVLSDKIIQVESIINKLNERKNILLNEKNSFISNEDLDTALKDFLRAESEYVLKKSEVEKTRNIIIDEEKNIKELKSQVISKAGILSISCDYMSFRNALNEMEDYIAKLLDLKSIHINYLNNISNLRTSNEIFDELLLEIDEIKYEISNYELEIKKLNDKIDNIKERLKLSGYEDIENRIILIVDRLNEIPKREKEIQRRLGENNLNIKNLKVKIEKNKIDIPIFKDRKDIFEKAFFDELSLKYVIDDEKILNNETEKIIKYLRNDYFNSFNYTKDDIIEKLNKIFYENKNYLINFNISREHIFEENFKRIDIKARFQSVKVSFNTLILKLKEEVENIKELIKVRDKELFEDILADTIGKRIRAKIYHANSWVKYMNDNMENMDTSSGLKLRLKWKEKVAEADDQLDTKELIDLLKKDANMMKEKELNKLSEHFRSKVREARRILEDKHGTLSFFSIIKDTLDYRKWFQFKIIYEKTGERAKELTDNNIGQLSGGERAISMYVPLFSAVVSKYISANNDAPKIISLDEAFAGVDNNNIRVLAKVMMDFEFNFILNSQSLWGDIDTIDSLSIYQLIRPNNVKFISVIAYEWNGRIKRTVYD